MKRRAGWIWKVIGVACLIGLCVSGSAGNDLSVLQAAVIDRDLYDIVWNGDIQQLWLGENDTAQSPSPNQLYALSAVLMDGHSGRVLYEKNGFEILPMASTTKIMTCILALEHGDLDDMLSVSSYAASMPQVKLGVHSGERYRLEDLLYSLMLESHNDTAVVVAEGVAGSVEAFAELMNQKARDIGAYDTFFVTPNGLDATAMCQTENGRAEERAHSTTAADLARILRYCITESPQREMFLQITQADSHQFMDSDGRRTFHCYNHNAFLDMMEGALTGKTGFTSQAGYCYVGAVEQDGEMYIVALLACGWPNNKSYKWADMRKLVTYGLENYEYRDVWQEVDPIFLTVTDGVPEDGSPDGQAYVELAADKLQSKDDLREEQDTDTDSGNKDQQELRLLLREDEQVQIQVETERTLSAPVQAGTIAGTVTYTLGDEIVKTYNLITTEDVALRDFRWYLNYVWNQFLSGNS